LEWRLPNGSVAYKVQAIDTGDIMTIAENSSVVPTETLTVPVSGSATPMVVKTMTTKNYHWGQSTTSPPGAPIPPASALESASCGQGLCGTPACDCQEGAPISGSRPLFPRLRQALGGGDTSPGTTRYPVVSGEQQITETPSDPANPGVGSRIREGLQTMFKRRVPADQVVTAQASPAATGDKATSESAAAPPPPSVLPPADKMASDPNDWRKSWGQPVDHKSQVIVKLPEDKSGAVLPPNSVTEIDRRPDPLVNPEKLVQRVEEKLATPKPTDFHPFDKLPPPPPAPGSDPTLGTGYPGAPAPQAFNGKMPMGVQSVLAAGGPMTQVQYLPVPVVTVPPVRPPSPPNPGQPQPPQPPQYVNAFTSSPSGAMPDPQALAQAQAIAMMAQRQGMPMTSPSSGMAYGQNAYPLPPGYGPNAYTAGPGYMSNPYYAAGQGAGASYPNAGSPPPAIPQQMPPNVLASYQGPTPPNPFAGAPVVPAGYLPPALPSVAVNSAMDRRAIPAPTAIAAQPTTPEMLKQLTSMLHDSLYPSQRELAAEGLTNYDWHYYPQAVQALLVAAREDPAPQVRATCVRCLVKLNIRGESVLSVLGALGNDADPQVRKEAEQALVRLH